MSKCKMYEVPGEHDYRSLGVMVGRGFNKAPLSEASAMILKHEGTILIESEPKKKQLHNFTSDSESLNVSPNKYQEGKRKRRARRKGKKSSLFARTKVSRIRNKFN